MLSKKVSGEAINIGSLTDFYMTENIEDFDKFYVVLREKAPSGKMLDFCECFINCRDLEQSFVCSGYKQDKVGVIEIFQKQYIGWCEEQEKVREGGRQIVTADENERACKVVDSINRCSATKALFTASEREEVFKQLEIFWKYEGIDLKSKLDLVKIDHLNKIIYIIDLKTTGFAVDSFKESIEKYQYWLQLYMYGLAFYYEFKNKIENIHEYKCQFKWIVESTKYPGSPCIFNMSHSDELKAENGGTINGKYYKGFKELISDYKWYLEHDEWVHKRELIENNFEVDISIFN